MALANSLKIDYLEYISSLYNDDETLDTIQSKNKKKIIRWIIFLLYEENITSLEEFYDNFTNKYNNNNNLLGKLLEIKNELIKDIDKKKKN
jgi:ribosomal 50S subunit-associated protein YjgA (DUF615 family)